MKITVAAPAKVNLWLRVGPRESSGFHGLDTLFCGLQLADTLVLRSRTPDDDGPLETAFAPPLKAPPDLGPPDSNLALRAARAFAERAGVDALPHIRLVKRVPAGGGLGGGSSDAAAVLRGMRRLHPGAIDGDGLREIGEELGSDVPFFLLGSPLAHGAGRGERLTPLAPLSMRWIVLVLPPFGVSTTEAFGWLDTAREQGEVRPPDVALHGADQPTAESAGDWDAVAGRAANDFEPVVFARHPELAELRDVLRGEGAAIALLAGSGSTLFGVYDSADAAEAAAARVRRHEAAGPVVVTRTRTR